LLAHYPLFMSYHGPSLTSCSAGRTHESHRSASGDRRRRRRGHAECSPKAARRPMETSRWVNQPRKHVQRSLMTYYPPCTAPARRYPKGPNTVKYHIICGCLKLLASLSFTHFTMTGFVLEI
jgi:hypothetical protein